MIACGTVVFRICIFVYRHRPRGATDSGIKLNIARSVVSFDEDADPAADYRVGKRWSFTASGTARATAG